MKEMMMEVLYWATFAGAILVLLVNAWMWEQDDENEQN